MTKKESLFNLKEARLENRSQGTGMRGWRTISAMALGFSILVGCGSADEMTEPEPTTTESAPPVQPVSEPEVEPPPPVEEPEPEPIADTSEVRVPDDAEIWAEGYTGVLMGLDGNLYEGYHPLTVERIQQALSQLGFYGDAVDGTFDRETMEAIADFQAQNDLPITGVPTPRTRARLSAESG